MPESPNVPAPLKQDPYRKELEGMLMTHVAPLFGSPAGHLRAKAAWLSGVYADVKFADGYGSGPHFSALFRAIVAALDDAELPVCVAMTPPCYEIASLCLPDSHPAADAGETSRQRS